MICYVSKSVEFQTHDLKTRVRFRISGFQHLSVDMRILEIFFKHYIGGKSS